MSPGRFIGRTLQIGVCGAVILCSTPGRGGPERSKPDKRACAIAYKSAPGRQQSSRLREAKDLYQACSKPACSALMRQECMAKYTQLEADIPSIVPLVTDATGALRADVQVTMDGEVLTSHLDGHALPVEPGTHEFSFNAGGGVIGTQRILIVEGQRNRRIAISLRAEAGGQKRVLASSVTPRPIETNLEPRTYPDSAAPRNLVSNKSQPQDAARDAPPSTVSPDRRKGRGPLPYAIGGAGLAALGTGALLTLWGKKDNDALTQCQPNCSQSSVDHIRSMYTVADISFGVGVAALGVATYLFVTSGATKEKPPTRAAYVFDVQPKPSGAFASVSGLF
jgi:hypothetical protein